MSDHDLIRKARMTSLPTPLSLTRELANRLEAANTRANQLEKALPPDPDSVPQWGVDDYREAVRKCRRAVLASVPAESEEMDKWMKVWSVGTQRKMTDDPIRHAFNRLLDQDSWEQPYVDAAREAYEALVAHVDQLEKALRWIEAGKTGSYGSAAGLARAALAGVPAEPAAEEKCHCCGRAVEPRDPDPWEGRMDGYCYDCSLNRCDCLADECPVRAAFSSAGAGQVPADTIARLSALEHVVEAFDENCVLYGLMKWRNEHATEHEASLINAAIDALAAVRTPEEQT